MKRTKQPKKPHVSGFRDRAPTLADLFPKSLHEFSRQRTLVRGDVVYVDAPMTLAPSLQLNMPDQKGRPFMVLDEAVNFSVNEYGRTAAPVHLLGIDCSSKPGVVYNRPHFVYEIPDRGTSYLWFDAIATVAAVDERLTPVHKFSSQEVQKFQAELDKLLRPTHVLTLFNGDHHRFEFGRILDASVRGFGDTKSLVLLQHPLTAKNMGHSDRGPPYLVALFSQAGGSTLKPDPDWTDFTITPVYQFVFGQGHNSIPNAETAMVVMNRIRTRAGLEPVELERTIPRRIEDKLAPAMDKMTSFVRKYRGILRAKM